MGFEETDEHPVAVDAGVPVKATVEGGVKLFGGEAGVSDGFDGVAGFVGVLLLKAAEREFGEVGGAGWGEGDCAVGRGFDELKHKECKSGDGHVVFGGRLVFR